MLVTIKVKAKNDAHSYMTAHHLSQLPIHARRHLSPGEFDQWHGSDPTTIQNIAIYAQLHGLTVYEACTKQRHVIVEGDRGTIEAAFGHSIYASDIEAVLGLNPDPVIKPYMRPATAAVTPLTTAQVAQLYNFPAGLDGNGQTIALVELGGGYTQTDLDQYFTGVGLPTPAIVSVPVLTGTNSPGQDADGEVLLDIEVAGTIAPKSKIAVYFAPNTSQGFVQAITKAAHDQINQPSVISISWGGPENTWSRSDITAMNNAIRDALLLGVTVTVAAGDNGSGDGERGNHVDFPASSPYALACGGTRLLATGEQSVWNDGTKGGATGGGISATIVKPSYQSKINIPFRGVPDVAGNADPDSGYLVVVHGKQIPIGGTSAVAPLWAGLIALLNQHNGKRLGGINTLLYTTARPGLNEVLVGNNGAFKAGPNWNACTGLGTPDGTKLMNLLK